MSSSINAAQRKRLADEVTTSTAHFATKQTASSGADKDQASTDNPAPPGKDVADQSNTAKGDTSKSSATSSNEGKKSPSSKDLYPMVNWKYDVFSWFMSITIDLFFREVHPRGAWKVPKEGPVLFVAAPHANQGANRQFIDAIVLQRVLRSEAGRRISLLIAQKSVHGFVGWGSRQTGSVPVGRSQDYAKPASGTIYLPDPINDPTLVYGVDTNFTEEAAPGHSIFLPSAKKQSGASVDVAEVLGPRELRIRRPLQTKLAIQQLTGRDDVDEDGAILDKDTPGPKPGYGGTKYKLAPRIDQTKVYEAVFGRLRNGGCVGIFPEGGSHDRTELLPIKAGVAVMALGTLAESPDCGLTIVPVGMNYFHAHKFRSRAVVEFGAPFSVSPKLVEMYSGNKRREAIGQLLDQIYQALNSVTVSTPDYDTLMLIQAARRLYNPLGKKLPLPVVVELNRRLALGYEKYKDDERIVTILEDVKQYNRQLRYLNLRDHQIQYARMSLSVVLFTLVYRIAKLLILFVCTLPGLLLFSPVFISTKIISRKKAQQALAGSSVKIQGRDVMATWKVLVALAAAPTVYNFYSLLVTFKTYQDRVWGLVPDWVPLWFVFLATWGVMIAITFASLRFGEVGMDIFKSLRPLFLCLFPSSSYNIHNLRERRAELSKKVTDLINTLGPEMFPDFDKSRLLVADQLIDKEKLAQNNNNNNVNNAISPSSSTPTSATSVSGGSGNWSHLHHFHQTHFADGTKAALRAGLSSFAGQYEWNHDRSGSDQSVVSGYDGEIPPFVRRSTMPSRALARNDSFSNIGGVGMFPTRPPSRTHSRDGTASKSEYAMMGSGFGNADAHGSLEEASRRIREAMRMRRRRSIGVANNQEADKVVDGGEEDEHEESRPYDYEEEEEEEDVDVEEEEEDEDEEGEEVSDDEDEHARKRRQDGVAGEHVDSADDEYTEARNRN